MFKSLAIICLFAFLIPSAQDKSIVEKQVPFAGVIIIRNASKTKISYRYMNPHRNIKCVRTNLGDGGWTDTLTYKPDTPDKEVISILVKFDVHDVATYRLLKVCKDRGANGYVYNFRSNWLGKLDIYASDDGGAVENFKPHHKPDKSKNRSHHF